MSDTLLETLQADVVAMLKATPSLALANILLNDAETTDSKVENAVKTLSGPGGKRGLALVVLRPEITEGEKNLPGPPLTLRIEVQCVEQPLLNRGSDGTNIRSSTAALRVLSTLQLASLGNLLLYTDKDPIKAVQVKTGYVSDAVTLFAKFSGVVTARPQAVQVELTTVSTVVVSGATPSSVNGTYTQIANQNGLPAWSKDGDAVPEDGVEGIIYGLAGFWYLKREVYGVDYSAVVAIGVSTTPVGLTGWSVTGGSGQPTLAAGPTTSTLALTCASAGSAIRYTTDGSYPSPSKTLYTAPFALPAAGTLVRASAYVAGQAPGDVLEFTVTP